MLYAGAEPHDGHAAAVLDLPEANAMRAPGEATGHMALEIAMDELAEKLAHGPGGAAHPQRHAGGAGPQPPQSADDPQGKKPSRRRTSQAAGQPFSQRQLVRACAWAPSASAGTSAMRGPAQVRDGRWLVGMGVAAAYRGAPVTKSAARVRLDGRGVVTVETDMTDIGTGSYTIIAQTAAEMMGVPLNRVFVRLGRLELPGVVRLGRAVGRASSTAGVYAACVKLREAVAQKLGSIRRRRFADGRCAPAGRSVSAGASRRFRASWSPRTPWSTATWPRRRSNRPSARTSSKSASMPSPRDPRAPHAGRVRGRPHPEPEVGAQPGDRRDDHGRRRRLMEELAVDKRLGFFVNHDLAATKCRCMPTSRTRT
jgi:xanthine dehydrogenase YagR molybdenum-binding subunit